MNNPFADQWVLLSAIAAFHAWIVWMLCRTLWKYWLKKILIQQAVTKRTLTQTPHTHKGGFLEQHSGKLWETLGKNPALQTLRETCFFVFPNHRFEALLKKATLLSSILFFALWLFLDFGKALFITGCTLMFGYALVTTQYQKIRNKYTNQLPDTLDALSNAMQAGYSFPQALIFVERESLHPIQTLLQTATSELNYNFSVEEVLENMNTRAKNRDVSLVCEGLLMQLRIGGNLAQMMKKEAHIIRERLSLEKDIQAATSQGRLSGLIIALLWPLSALLFSYISPEYISVLFYTPQGQTLLFFGFILEIIGFYMIWRITTVKI